MVAGDSHDDLDARRFRDDRRHGAPPRGARQLSALLPNGRTLWLRVADPLAPVAAVRHVAQLADTIADHGHASTAAHAGAIARLSHTVAADARRFDARQLARAHALRRRIVAADNAVDARLAKARDEFRARLDKQLKIDHQNVRRLRRRDLWDKILIASSLPLFAAYGERDDVFGSNNLTLTLALLIFLAGDQVVEALIGSDTPKSPYALDDADAWSYLAPFANVLAGWWLLGDRQHERFVTGRTTLTLKKQPHVAPDGAIFYRYRAEVDLMARIGKDHVQEFVTFSGVPAVASMMGVRWSPESQAIDPTIDMVTAAVDAGILTLRVRAHPRAAPPLGAMPSDLGELDIAWMVDTNKPPAAAPAT